MDSEETARLAKAAFQESQLLPSSERINALLAIRKQLELQKSDILAANVEDLKVCKHLGLFPCHD
jgi:glutamate-5-semialdehyde dehydrogenase